MKLLFKTSVKGHFKEVASQFNVEMFKKLSPPGGKMFIHQFDGTKKGDQVYFTAVTLGMRQDWKGLITDSGEDESKSYFVDIGKEIPAPLKSWTHRHLFEKINENETMIVDEVEYHCSMKILDYLTYPFWQFYFNYRSYIYKKTFG